MRKWLWYLNYILIALIVILLLLPPLMGFFAESKCRQLANINSTFFPFKIKIISYKRGWFGADATAQMSLDNLKTKDQRLNQFIITAHITHGPIIADWLHTQFAIAMVKTNFYLNEIQNAFLHRAINSPIAIANIKIKLNAATGVFLEIPPFSYLDGENSFQWQGLKMRVDFSRMFSHMHTKINLLGIDTKVSKNYSLQLGQVLGDYQGKKIADSVWFGEGRLQIKTLFNKDENNHSITFNGLNMYNIIADKGTVSAATSIMLDNLKLDNNSYNRSSFSFEAKHLDKNLLVKMWQKYLHADQGTFDALITLLSNGGEINIKQLNTTSSWGKLLAAAKIVFANQPDNKNSFAVMMNSTVDANVKVERTFAVHLIENLYEKTQLQKQAKISLKELAEALLNDWQKSGKILASDKDPYLQAIFVYKDHKILLNNKPLTISNNT